jgi:sensor histidine kinase YesM
MGLGLYISRQLARKMNGEVWISHSVVGEGTTLSVRLLEGKLQDANQAVEQGIVKRENLNKHSPLPVAKQHWKKLLLVDDEPTNIRVLSLMLEEEFELFTAYQGGEALKLLQNHRMDLVIADMMMPGMSGIELTERIRKTHSVIDLPIIIATVRDSDKDIELAYQAGANDYITKPFTAEAIQSRVKNLLQLTDAVETALQNEIAFLQAQIKPHFIYNALSNIIALCYEDGERAAELLSLLSRYLRHIFQADQSRHMLPLQQELDIIKAYVEIEKLRFGDRLRYETYIDPVMMEEAVMVPALLIQPLIENAIRHGIFDKIGPGTVSLVITEGEDFIRIVVEDDGIGMSEDQVYRLMHREDGKGVGIKNIRKRVESFPKASFSMDSELEKGTKCMLFLPK